jgi:hypothetical protein
MRRLKQALSVHPKPRMAAPVKDSEDNGSILIGDIEHGEWKSTQ